MQRILGIRLDIHAVYQDFSFCCIIESRHQIHYSTLSASGGTDQCNGLSGFRSKGNIFQDIFLRIRIPEADITEFNLSFARLCGIRLRSVQNRRFCLQYFQNSLCSNGSTWQQNKNHYHHNKGHDNLNGIGGKHDHIRKQLELFFCLRPINQIGSHPIDGQCKGTVNQLNARHQKCHYSIGKKVGGSQRSVGTFKFLFLICFCIICTHDTQSRQIFPGHTVQVIGQSLQLLVPRHGKHHADTNQNQQHHNCHPCRKRPLPVLIGNL